MSDRPEDRNIGPEHVVSPTPESSQSAPSASTQPVASDAPQPPQAPPGHPGPPAPPVAASTYSAPPAVGPSGQAGGYGQPSSAAQNPVAYGQNPAYGPPASYSGPTTGAFGQPTAFGQPGTAGQPGTPGDAGGIPPAHIPPTAASTGSADGKPRRKAPLGLVAALAVGALVGGVSGAGVTAVVLANNDGAQSSSSSTSTPTNITVNDDADATIVTAVAASAGPSVVTISVSDEASGSGGTGSGVILSEDGYVLTNSHVVTLDGATGSPTVSVQTSDGRLYGAEVVGTDPVSDLAVIKIDGTGDFRPADFADSSKLNVGDTAIAIGAPLGLSNTVTNGIVSSLNRSITVASSAAPEDPSEQAPQDPNDEQGPFDFWQFGTPEQEQQQTAASSTISLSVIQTDAAINPGNSGGALLDSDGKVIGVNVAIASAGQGSGSSQSGSIGVGFAIPSNLAKRIADEIIQNGTGSHGLLGASVDDVTSEDAGVVGAQIVEVTAGGAAAAAGLKAGDVVTSINGLPVTGRTDLTAQVRALAAGSAATITYVRGGDSDSVDVTLGSLN